jgi:DNA damage-inducible protein 1
LRLAPHDKTFSTMDQAPIYFPEDEQYARDLQVAYDLHAREERRAQRRGVHRGPTNNHEPSETGDGFIQGAVSADHMLFVECAIDSQQVSMLVDTGASSSVMSMKVRFDLGCHLRLFIFISQIADNLPPSILEQMVSFLGLERKMNSSFHGSAQGVGSSSVLGIVENVDCRIGHVGFRSFFLVLEGSMPYCILGLDQLRRFNCVVDVGGNSLVFGGRDGVSVPFLPQELAANVASTMMSEGNERTDA